MEVALYSLYDRTPTSHYLLSWNPESPVHSTQMASFTSLPPEIVQSIVHVTLEMQPGMACKYATVSRDWQALVEKKTFSSLRLNSMRVQELSNILTPRRRSYVRNIAVEVTLPEYDVEKAGHRKETPQEQHTNSQTFTDLICALFAVLATWKLPADGATGEQRGVSLSLSASSPSDQVAARGYRLRNRKKRWASSCLYLTKHPNQNLPSIPVVSKFSCADFDTQRKLAPITCCEIAEVFPNVHTLDWNLLDNERRDLARRIKLREDFAIGISKIPQSVRHFKLAYGGGSPQNHDWSPPRLYNGDDSTSDPLSAALHSLLPRLVVLELHECVTIGTELFWPASSSTPLISSGISSQFPRLEKLSVGAGMVAPSGKWLFIEDPRIVGRHRAPSIPTYLDDEDIQPGDIPLHWYRYQLDHDLGNPYFLAAAYAARHMPRLKTLDLTLGCTGLNTMMAYDVLEDGRRASLGFFGSPPFDPSHEVKEAWRDTTEVLVGDRNIVDIQLTDEETDFGIYLSMHPTTP